MLLSWLPSLSVASFIRFPSIFLEKCLRQTYYFKIGKALCIFFLYRCVMFHKKPLSTFRDMLQISQLLQKLGRKLQSTLVISKSKGHSETLRDIRTSTYQICRIEANTNGTTKFLKRTCNLTPLLRNIR